MDVTGEQIAGDIRALGVRPGDLLLVHSSLSRIGRVPGGAEAAARGLVESVSPGGTVFVPTFNYGQLPYDPLTTPSLAGAITDAFWRLPGALRSLHPTHPVAAVGPGAAEILLGHERATPFGRGSPLWRLWERNCRVLLIGCDHVANSMIHVAEESENLPYLQRTRATKALRGGNWVEEIVRCPGDSRGFNKVDATLRASGWVIDGAVGAARVLLMRAADIVEAARGMLRGDPASLLCDEPDCPRCAAARAALRQSTQDRMR